MGEENGQLVLPKRTSYGNVLVLFYWQLPLGRNYTSFGVKYPNVLLSMKIRNYEEMFVEPLIYIRYVVLTIVIFTSMLAIELFYNTQLCSFHGFSLSTYLYLSIYRFVAYT